MSACHHTNTRMELDPNEAHVGPSVEVCADCGMSRKHSEQDASPWLMVTTPLSEFRQNLRDTINAMPLKEAGLFILDAAQAFLDKRTNYSPSGTELTRMAKVDGKLTVCLAQGSAAPMLSTAYDALKEAMGL